MKKFISALIMSAVLSPCVLAKMESPLENVKSTEINSEITFEQEMWSIQNNVAFGTIRLDSKDFTSEQMIQLIEAVKGNTSADAIMVLDSNHTLFNEGVGNHDSTVVTTLADLILMPGHHISSITLSGHNSDKEDPAGHFDYDSFITLTTAMKKSRHITKIDFDDWEISRAVGKEIYDLAITKKNLKALSLYMVSCGRICNYEVSNIVNALEKNHISSISLGLEQKDSAPNSNVANALGDVLSKNSALLEFSLYGFPVNDKIIAKFSKTIADSKTLKEVSFTDNAMTDDMFATLANGLSQNTSLSYLHLGEQHLTNSNNLNLLLNIFSYNSHLAIFSMPQLFSTPIDRGTWQSFADKLARNQTLAVLYLYDVKMDDDGLIAISEAVKTNDTLRYLFLTQNNFTIKGVNSLVDAVEVNSTLYHVSIGNFPVQQEKINEFTYRNLHNIN
jgi:Ran GTPase-activating protein (RanGAP) involved in mRNA processing and transport